MQIFLNDKKQMTESGSTLASLLRHTQGTTDGIAVIVNQQVISKSQWVHHQLTEGDRVTVFTAMAGG